MYVLVRPKDYECASSIYAMYMYVCFCRSADNISFISSQCNLLREDFNSVQKKLADDVEYLSGVVADMKISSQQNLESIAKVRYMVYVCMHVCMYARMYVYMYVQYVVCMYVCM